MFGDNLISYSIFCFCDRICDLHHSLRYLPLPVAKACASAYITLRLDDCNYRFHNVDLKDVTLHIGVVIYEAFVA